MTDSLGSLHRRIQQMGLWRINNLEPVSEKRGLVITTSLDVKGAFDAAWWPGILKGLKDLKCPRNSYNPSKGYFSNITAVMNSNSIAIDRRVTKGSHNGPVVGQATELYADPGTN
jgi:hypothetical protein